MIDKEREKILKKKKRKKREIKKIVRWKTKRNKWK